MGQGKGSLDLKLLRDYKWVVFYTCPTLSE
jgi:hypothetical protein